MEKTNVLVVDDERGVRESIRESLGEDYNVSDSESGEQALKKLEDGRFDLVMLDINLPGMDGIETLQNIKKHDQKLPVVMISVIDGLKTVVSAMKLGAEDYINKPFNVSDIKSVVQGVLRKYGGIDEKKAFPYGVQVIISEFVRTMSRREVSMKEATDCFELEIKNLLLNRAN